MTIRPERSEERWLRRAQSKDGYMLQPLRLRYALLSAKE
mgnify:FL=1|jgi:hypothetical protein